MADDLGYFVPGSVTRRVLADPAVVVGGIRALFLQALHPRAMADVHQHSDFSNDFWPRLQRTAQYVTTVGFGTRVEADAAATRVRAMHRRVRGVDSVTGGRYAATDSDLLRWVHVTEVSSILRGLRITALRVPEHWRHGPIVHQELDRAREAQAHQPNQRTAAVSSRTDQDASGALQPRDRSATSCSTTAASAVTT